MHAMFKRDFLWGASEAGFQFEMGDAAGKYVDPNSDWFKWVHDPTNIARKVVSGDPPEDGVNYWELYPSDHDLAKSMGMNTYRVGIEWSRVFPKSTAGLQVGVKTSNGVISEVDIDPTDIQELEETANNGALRHYGAIIEDLRSKGLKVIVCLNHFTLPLWVHDPIAVRDSGLRKGPRGWYDASTVVEFTKFAAFVASKLGDRVDMWATFNEPMVVAEEGYLEAQSGFPPGINMNIPAAKRVARNMVNAHARTYDVIKKFDTRRADGDSPSPAWIGVIHNMIPAQPLNPSNRLDQEAAALMDRIHNRLFVEATVSGWFDSNLNGVRDGGEAHPHFGNRLDWLGVNYYTRYVVRGKASILARIFAGLSVMPEQVEGYGYACEPKSVSLAGRPTSEFRQELYPEGLGDSLVEASQFGRPMYITENGTADSDDTYRPRYLLEHLRVAEQLVDERKVDLRGYLHWSLTDNYEWAEGFRMKFGLAHVDLKTKARKIGKSANVFKQIAESDTTEGVSI